MEVIMQMGNELLVNLLVGVLSVLAALAICGVQKGIVYLKQQTAQLKDDGLRATLDSALEDVGRLAEVTVGSIEQTTAGVLRDAKTLSPSRRKPSTRSKQPSHRKRRRSSPGSSAASTTTSKS